MDQSLVWLSVLAVLSFSYAAAEQLFKSSERAKYVHGLETCERNYKKLGCFRPRVTTMTEKFSGRSGGVYGGVMVDMDYRKKYMHSLACRCAKKARKEGSQYFSIRFMVSGECWIGKSYDELAKILNDETKRSTRCITPSMRPCVDSEPTECAGRVGIDYMYSLVDHGTWSAWSYSTCTKTCDGGTQTRSRSCDKTYCLGVASGSQSCNEQPCKAPPTSEVSCGNHKATDCSQCPEGHGAFWCHGDCKWCHGSCVPKARWCGRVRCGEHAAETCKDCPTGKGLIFRSKVKWCKGDCQWCRDECKDKSFCENIFDDKK